MKYWVLKIKFQDLLNYRVDKITLKEIEKKNEFINSSPMEIPCGKEQYFTSEKDAYRVITDLINKPHYTHHPMTDNGKKSLMVFETKIREKYPELLI